MRKSEFSAFYASLSELNGALHEVPLSEIAGSINYRKILEGIETIKYDQLIKLQTITDFDPKDIVEDLDNYFDPVFKIDSENICDALKRSTGDFFYVKKSFQLSHIRKQLSGISKDKVGMRNYFYLQLYSDYFETLTKRLQGLCILVADDFQENDETRVENIKSSDRFYRRILSRKPMKVLEFIRLNNDLRKHRNKLSHGQVLCGDGHIEVIDNAKKSVNYESETTKSSILKADYFPRLNSLMVFLVLFSTEFDLRFFRLIERQQLSSENTWKEYFDLYFKSWQAQQQLFSSN